MSILICANDGCEVEFTPRTHNQKYHDDECCRISTNRRIMEKYYQRQAQRQGKTRYCHLCEITKLSRYNDGEVCSSCKSKTEVAANNKVVDMLLNASLTI